MAFAISLSVTRYVAVLAARVSTTPVRTALSFTVLLVVHVLLLIYWSVVIYGLQAALIVVLMRGLTLLGVEGFDFFSDGDLGQRIVDVFRSLFWPDQEREGLKVAPVMWSALFSLSHTKFTVTIVWLYAFKVAMDIVANGLRILLALVFLSSFLFRPLIQAPISRLWYGAMASDRPVFTLLFGTTGAIIGAIQVLAGLTPQPAWKPSIWIGAPSGFEVPGRLCRPPGITAARSHALSSLDRARARPDRQCVRSPHVRDYALLGRRPS